MLLLSLRQHGLRSSKLRSNELQQINRLTADELVSHTGTAAALEEGVSEPEPPKSSHVKWSGSSIK